MEWDGIGLVAIGVVRVLACIALLLLGWRFRRGVIVWLGMLASAATVPYLMAAGGADLSQVVIGASGALHTALIITCVWAAIDSQAHREEMRAALRSLRIGAGT